MKAIGYVRVSTEKQADFGVSLEAQSEKVRAMAVVQGTELAEVIVSRDRFPPIFPPLAPCFLKNSRMSGGSLLAMIQS